MLINETWLKSWVKTDIDVTDLSESLTLAGLEVAGVTRCESLSPQVVVGEIVAIENHPSSNKLTLCDVDIGKHRPLKVVCGAPNARVGVKSAMALIGAELPGKGKIAKARIQDIVSSGMLCSFAELGIDEDVDGIAEFDSTAKNGVPVNDHLGLVDNVLDIELTPNRGDCLSVSGIAREVSTLTSTVVRGPKLKPYRATSGRKFSISIKVPEDCPRYVGRVIEGIRVDARTPDFIRERLRKCGLRPISLAVDITNYVMLELGQPMHAFDLDKLNRGIIVRHSRKGEEIDLLDGSHMEIPAGTLLIADYRGPIALAGIMGGADTAISGETTHILLESACFRPGAIAGRARAIGMHTDSSHRFERGVDPELQVTAIQRATELLVSAAGGSAGPVIDVVSKKDMPRRQDITLRRERLHSVLGIKIRDVEVERILNRLGMNVRALLKGWRVRPPSPRYDIEGEHDLIEEVARIYGYQNIPAVSPRAEPGHRNRTESRLTPDRFKHFLVDRDYREIISYSFVDPTDQARMDPGNDTITLKNPIASNMSVMRTTLWTGLITILASNYRRQHRRIRLFETGHVFLTESNQRIEKSRFGGAVTGPLMRNDWGDGRLIDFFDVKGEIESLLAINGCREAFSFLPGRHPALHPGQCARITRSGKTIGWLGRMHPILQKEYGLDQPVYLFEMEMKGLIESSVPEYEPISKFPATRRDLSIVVDQSVSASRLRDTINSSGGKRLVDVELFDIYQGKGVPDGQRSLSYTLTLQDSSRNLTDEDIEEVTRRILNAVEKRTGGKLRT
ncbi:MAG: phenylalanine--tRNA ligase beta subunit [marine bacterium B5-7]|nr:MAG: phenylalanine--tRNA ligase beta subunit [marine bacterium B5-7]